MINMGSSGVLYSATLHLVSSKYFMLVDLMPQQKAVPDDALLWAKIREIHYIYLLFFISNVYTRALVNAEGQHNRPD